jgi:hypothetical protein
MSVKEEDSWDCDNNCDADTLELVCQNEKVKNKVTQMQRINFSIPTWFDDLFEHAASALPTMVNIFLYRL